MQYKFIIILKVVIKKKILIEGKKKKQYQVNYILLFTFCIKHDNIVHR